jgi:hypothetical protein
MHDGQQKNGYLHSGEIRDAGELLPEDDDGELLPEDDGALSPSLNLKISNGSGTATASKMRDLLQRSETNLQGVENEQPLEKSGAALSCHMA